MVIRPCFGWDNERVTLLIGFGVVLISEAIVVPVAVVLVLVDDELAGVEVGCTVTTIFCPS